MFNFRRAESGWSLGTRLTIFIVTISIHQDLGLIPPEEWDTFMATMRESLPATFRITGTRLLAEHVRTCLEKKFFGHLSQIEVEGETVPPPKPLTW